MPLIGLVTAFCAHGYEARMLLKNVEIDSIEITELPLLGICLNLEGDSLVYLDDPELPVLHLPAKTDARHIIVCDSSLYVAVGAAVYADTCTTPLIVLDNEQFRLYPATESTFYVCTADSAFTNLILVDPSHGAYSVVGDFDFEIDKIVANDVHTFALTGDQIVALGAGSQYVTLYQGDGINDIALSPIGMLIATDEGLYRSPRSSEIEMWSERPLARVWWIAPTLYVLDTKGNLMAIDGIEDKDNAE